MQCKAIVHIDIYNYYPLKELYKLWVDYCLDYQKRSIVAPLLLMLIPSSGQTASSFCCWHSIIPSPVEIDQEMANYEL